MSPELPNEHEPCQQTIAALRRELAEAREDRAILAWLYRNAYCTTSAADTQTPIMLPTREAILADIEEERKEAEHGERT